MALRSKTLICKRVMLFSLLPLSFFTLMYWLLQKPVFIDLADNQPNEVATLLASWEKGEVVAVIHPLERCEGLDVPCLNTENGITKRARGAGYALAEDLQILGLHKADIFYSPQQATDETSQILFGYDAQAEPRLAQCTDGYPLSDVMMGNKRSGRNLVFVVDEQCISEFQKSLGTSPNDFTYATILFAEFPSASGKPRLIGFVKAEDWLATFGW